MLKKYSIYLIALFWIFTSCGKEQDDPDGFSYKLVVEGGIEEGNVPYVLLTQNKPLISIIDSTTIADIVVRWAKVSVSDGEKTEILTGRIDTNYFPPFIYKGSLLMGEAGKTYTLKVEYSGQIWTATTTIPESVPLKKIYLKQVFPADTVFTIEATFNDPAEQKNYYKLFTRVLHKNKRYLPALLGNFNDNLFNGNEQKITINQGIDQAKFQDFDSHFNIKDTVLVKFCTMPEFGFDFWTRYENELINGQNPFFPANKNQLSNISNNGLGLWCGYGREMYKIVYDK